MSMVLVKVPSSEGNLEKNPGCEKAPDKIVKLLKDFEIKEVKVVKGNLDKTGKNIEKIEGDIFVGGDHSITYFSFKSFSKGKKNPGLLILDAHLDCDYYTKTATHEDFVRKLVDEKILKKQNVIWLGVRKVFDVEKEFTKKLHVFEKNSVNKILDLCKKFSDLYLSIDIDVLDPKFAPGTGYHEKNGLTDKELFNILRKLKTLDNLRKIDLVEINPDLDENGKTIKLAAKIINILK